MYAAPWLCWLRSLLTMTEVVGDEAKADDDDVNAWVQRLERCSPATALEMIAARGNIPATGRVVCWSVLLG